MGCRERKGGGYIQPQVTQLQRCRFRITERERKDWADMMNRGWDFSVIEAKRER